MGNTVSMASRDGLRQGLTVFGALLQVVVGFFVPVGSLVDQDVSLIIPAGWAFSIWGPIFLLCLVYAAYQALPQIRRSPLLRRIGWPLGLAFVGNGVWTLVQPLQQPVLSQVIILVILLVALAALIRFARFQDVGLAERWIVGLPLGLLTGWLTAANVVGFNDMLVRLGVVGDGFAAALVGAGLLVVSLAVAALVVWLVAGGPLQATLTYAAGLGWGLFGVAANQYDSSLITTAVSVVCLVALALLLASALRVGRASGGERARVA